jgi:hypothetical protein
MPAKKINTFSGFSFLEVSGMDDNDNVIELSMNKKKRYDPYQQVPVTQQDANNIVTLEDTIRIKQAEEIQTLKDENTNLKEQLFESRRKLGILVSVNEMLKIQLQDLLSQLNFMDQHIKLTMQNAKNMLMKLPNISPLDLPLPPEKK